MWTQTIILGSKAIPTYSPGLKLTKFANNSELMTQTSIKLGNPNVYVLRSVIEKFYLIAL